MLFSLNSPQRALGNWIRFCWLPSEDLESGLKEYRVSVYDWNANEIDSTITSDVCFNLTTDIDQGTIYYAKVVAENNAGLTSQDVDSFRELSIDFMRPYDSSYALVYNSEPVLAVRTNNFATCTYSSYSGSTIEKVGSFIYSDGNYHETKLPELLEDEIYSVIITCIDNFGSAKTQLTRIKYSDSAVTDVDFNEISSSLLSNLIYSFEVQVDSNDKGLGDLTKNIFDLKIFNNDLLPLNKCNVFVYRLNKGYNILPLSILIL